jgi:hypothetical protein
MRVAGAWFCPRIARGIKTRTTRKQAAFSEHRSIVDFKNKRVLDIFATTNEIDIGKDGVINASSKHTRG